MSQNENEQWESVEFIIHSADAVIEQRYEDAISTMREGIENQLSSKLIIDSDKFLKSLFLLVTAIEKEAEDKFDSESKRIDKKHITIECSFCCKPKSETDTLIAGAKGYICRDCIINFNHFLESNNLSK